jgi:hypothetical protein
MKNYCQSKTLENLQSSLNLLDDDDSGIYSVVPVVLLFKKAAENYRLPFAHAERNWERNLA